MPRPRVLDEGKQREVCALLTAGMTMSEAAAYVGCCEKTIRREQRRDEAFDERVRRARMAARLGPLQAVREAAATHWRAAAWLVDRQDRQEERERRAQRERAKRKRQRKQAKRESEPRDWQAEIREIAAGRDAPGHESPTAGTARKRPSPVAAAMRELARQVAATANQPTNQPAGRAAREDPTRRTKPLLPAAERSAAEPARQGSNGRRSHASGAGFVPSLRVFGQNEAGQPAPTDREPPASAGGAEPSSAVCEAGCSGG